LKKHLVAGFFILVPRWKTSNLEAILKNDLDGEKNNFVAWIGSGWFIIWSFPII